MATKNLALRNKMADDFAALFNSGTIEIQDSEGAVLVEFPLHSTAFQAASDGSIAAHASSLTTQEAGAAGTAAKAAIKSSGGTYEISDLTVGTSNAMVIINNVSIALGQDVALLSISYTETANIVMA